MKRGFYTILSAQFLSSLADNALLIAAIALLTSINAPAWMTPLLRLFFVISYVVLAAWVGIFADMLPKGQVMFITNAIKVFGCLMMLLGLQPLLAYAIVGIGAAAYSPAKYGILTELLPPEQLVVANGWMEGLTVISIILGVVLGGLLVDPLIAHRIMNFCHMQVFGIMSVAESAIAVIVLVYAAAALVNLAIPETGAKYPETTLEFTETLKEFIKTCTVLWSDRLGQISMSVTTLFWGAGAVLQFLVLKWAEVALGMNLSQGAILQAVVSIGIAVGAVGAATFVPLKKSCDVLPMGVAMGVIVCCISFFDASMVPGELSLGAFTVRYAVIIAAALMIVVGALAGFFVVPMNALLQHRGYVLLSAGRSIAVQNFNENSSILIMLGLYSLLIKADLSVFSTMLLFGLFVAVCMFLVILKHRKNQSEYDSLHLIGEAKRESNGI